MIEARSERDGLCPSARRYQGRSANNPRLGFERQGITQRDSTQLSVGKSPQGFTKDRMNPFDLKAALLAKHAQHPVIIHFPIALFIVSVAFDLLAIWKRNPVLAKAAFYNLIGAALTAPVAIASGLTAWQWQLEGSKLKGNLPSAPALCPGRKRDDLAPFRVAYFPAETPATDANSFRSPTSCRNRRDRLNFGNKIEPNQ